MYTYQYVDVFLIKEKIAVQKSVSADALSGLLRICNFFYVESFCCKINVARKLEFRGPFRGLKYC